MPNNIGFGVQAKGVGKASSDLDKLRDKFDKLGKQGAKGFAIGAAAGATTFALGAMSQAVSEVTGVIGDAIKAAQEDEASQSRLRASLLANIPAWDGNTHAIEETLLAREKLGFSDDEQRDSLAKLVVATHDANKALEIQRTAMDLARLKNISLADAGDALTKVEAGQFRALKALGIVLKDGATATDALRAVQAAATGQAEAYAQTNEGKLLTSQVRVNEALEKLGYTLLPAVAVATDAAAGFAEDLAGNLDGVAKASKFAGDALKGLGVGSQNAADSGFDLVHAGQDLLAVMNPTKISNTAGVLLDTVDKLGVSTVSARDQLNGMGLSIQAVEAASDGSQDAIENMRGTFKGGGRAAAAMSHTVVMSARDIKKALDDLADAAGDDAQSMIDDYFDPIETRADIHDTRLSLFASQEALRLAKTKEAHRNAADDIIQALDDEGGELIQLGKKHKITAKDVDKFESDVKTSYTAMGKKIPPEIQKIIDKLRTLAKMTAHPFNVDVNANIATAGNKERASGGPVAAGVPYTVGEEGRELFVPNQNGTIIPHDQLAGMGGGDTYVFNIYPQGRWDVDNNGVTAAVQRLKAISKKRADVHA